jgi:hypothetical protein
MPTGEGIAFVSRTARNNGVAAWVKPIDGIEPLPPGLLTVSLRSRNSALATFVQPRPFYCGYHIFVLRPRRPMTLVEKLWWAQAIEANRYRYNFGRQANRSLSDLILPESGPAWVNSATLPGFAVQGSGGQPLPDMSSWKPFRLDSLFEPTRGESILKREMRPGKTPYVSASEFNNGVSAWVDADAKYQGGQITIAGNGSVGEVFYQPYPFIASGDVTVLQPRTSISALAALFVCVVTHADKYRWNYGRKWTYGRVKVTVIRLPATHEGTPDWGTMDAYVRTLPVAAALHENELR